MRRVSRQRDAKYTYDTTCSRLKELCLFASETGSQTTQDSFASRVNTSRLRRREQTGPVTFDAAADEAARVVELGAEHPPRIEAFLVRLHKAESAAFDDECSLRRF